MLCLLLLTIAQDTGPRFNQSLGHPNALVISGADAVGADTVRGALLADPECFDASFPMRRLSDYLTWLQNVTTLAYMHAGYVNVEVRARVDKPTGKVLLEIVEGKQRLAGEARFEGATHLNEDRVREVLRAGSVRRAPADAGVLPPALEGFDWRRMTGSPKPEPFWVPGRPAPASPIDQERVETLVESAVRAEGFLDAEVQVRLQEQDDAVHPAITVVEEGPRSTILEMSFEGALVETPEQLRAWAAIPADAPASASLRWTVEDRLEATGRFLDVRTRYEPVPDAQGQVVLAVRLVPNTIAPPVEDHPGEELALLVRGLERLKRLSLVPNAPRIGLDARVTLGRSVFAAVSKGLAVHGLDLEVDGVNTLTLKASVDQDSASLEILLATGAEATSPLVQLWVDADRGLAHCPPLGLELEFGSTDVDVMLIVEAAVKQVIDDPESPIDLNVSGGILTGGQAEKIPVRMDLAVHPSTLLYLLTSWAFDAESDENTLRLTLDSDQGQASVTAHRVEGSLVAKVHMDTDKVQGFFTLGDLGAREWTVVPVGATSTGSAVEARSLRAALGLLRTVTAASSVDESQASAGLLAVTGMQALSSAPTERQVTRGGATRPFRVPERKTPPVGAGQFRDISERLVMALLEHQKPDAWTEFLLRSVPMILAPANQNELSAAETMLSQVAQSPTLGPLGAWLAAEYCAAAGRTNWSQPMAVVGRKELSSARFLVDCATIFGAPGEERGAGPRRVAATWRGLHRHALDEQNSLMTADERASVKAIFGGISFDDDAEIWEAGLTHIWDALLRTVFERRLNALATPK